MTIEVPMSQPEPVNKGGRPKGSTGNGKTAAERIARAKQTAAVQIAEAEAAAKQAEAQRRRDQVERTARLFTEQEAKRAPQFQIDQRATLTLLGALALVTFIATAILTADGTIGSSVAARFASPVFGFILFGAFEVAILAFMLIYYVLGSRIDNDGNPVKATRWFVAMIGAATITVALSVYHVLDLYNYEWLNVDMWVGIFIRLVVALFFVVVSKGIATVLFARAIRL